MFDNLYIFWQFSSSSNFNSSEYLFNKSTSKLIPSISILHRTLSNGISISLNNESDLVESSSFKKRGCIFWITFTLSLDHFEVDSKLKTEKSIFPLLAMKSLSRLTER